MRYISFRTESGYWHVWPGVGVIEDADAYTGHRALDDAHAYCGQAIEEDADKEDGHPVVPLDVDAAGRYEDIIGAAVANLYGDGLPTDFPNGAGTNLCMDCANVFRSNQYRDAEWQREFRSTYYADEA